MKTSRNRSALRPLGQLGALVGDGDEVTRPLLDARLLDGLPEVRRQRVRLDRRAGLAGEDVERGAMGGSTASTAAGSVESSMWRRRPARRRAEDRPQHLRCEARAAHAEQHDVGEPVALDALRKSAQPLKDRRHQQRASRAIRAGARSSPGRRHRRPERRGIPLPESRCGTGGSGLRFGEGRSEPSRAHLRRALQPGASCGEIERGPAGDQVVQR